MNSFPITFVEFIVSSVSDSNYCKGRFFPRIIGLYNYFFLRFHNSLLFSYLYVSK
ncbi:hypothetical protein BACCOPRO_02270 [Phocaeicola coprophilus DSM 18228 = JCM 13818]|uniref:Uncharacterized protein n=1 Tax=Phocaeicola coprophilus DSM 18228 = JCM 13818 TaxID=547042 RepID=S0F8S4_9BACT|nr:hypothetical protein BACCOPRO_02270 [Phocaeicola coprophilus DSM 18228 = JCM 13818]